MVTPYATSFLGYYKKKCRPPETPLKKATKMGRDLKMGFMHGNTLCTTPGRIFFVSYGNEGEDSAVVVSRVVCFQLAVQISIDRFLTESISYIRGNRETKPKVIEHASYVII